MSDDGYEYEYGSDAEYNYGSDQDQYDEEGDNAMIDIENSFYGKFSFQLYLVPSKFKFICL